jgi:hypothetical protein
MIFSDNRYPPRIKSGAGFFGIMLYRRISRRLIRLRRNDSEFPPHRRPSGGQAVLPQLD